MQRSPHELTPGSEIHLLLPYVTDLEIEVDRLRKQGRFVEQQAWDTLKQMQSLCGEESSAENIVGNLAQIKQVASEFAKVLSDLHEQPGFHPSHDQVVPIAVRPLIEQVFRWQQRLENGQAVLRMELEIEYLNWFPARLRHIIDSLIANSLRTPPLTKVRCG